MRFYEVIPQTIALLQREGRVSYRALRLEFDLTKDLQEAKALLDQLSEGR